MTINKEEKFVPINISVLTISDTRTLENDKSGDLLSERIQSSGHKLYKRDIIKDDKGKIKKIIKDWSSDEHLNTIITTGGTGLTGRDLTPEALEEIFEKKIDGFSIIFHLMSYKKIGTSTLQSRTTAGILNSTYIFALPGSLNAVKDGWDNILKFQLDSRFKPCNFVEIIPRLDEK
ncbi:MAG: molybdenum cofactor biosynthesis protein B [Pseudomonadota bacterium]|nr:molybdenum cofactor biosynthesis protein B [Pseudomonadota bacterium]